MEFIEEFEFNNDAIGRGTATYKNRYLHVYKDGEAYLFFEIDASKNESYSLSEKTVDFLISNKRVINHKKLKKYVKVQTD